MKRLSLLLAFTLLLAFARIGADETGVRRWEPSALAEIFAPFAPKVKTHADERYFYIESDSMPDHPMMVGIRAWNQQVPLPQPYGSGNGFRLPLQPRFSAEPVSGKETLFLGAIAVAANGVPIFNPIKQDGRTDTYLAGELDEFGGHAGRADDYHYHLAPLHLADKIGPGKPVAWALDGYPIYGYEEPGGGLAQNLDWLNGHTQAELGYHYHASKQYPYLNGGFKGEVELRDGEVAVQPRARGVRPFTRPLRGAAITGFEALGANRNRLEYRLSGQTYGIEYSFDQRGAEFTFIGPDGSRQTQTYARREGGRRGGQRPPQRRGPPEGEARKPWLQVHAPEMDLDQDGRLTGAELRQEVSKTFAGYDRNSNGKIEAEELRGPGVRSALGGFVREHREEIDSDGDASLTRDELAAVMDRMFARGDADGDGALSVEELASMTAGRPRR